MRQPPCAESRARRLTPAPRAPAPRAPTSPPLMTKTDVEIAGALCRARPRLPARGGGRDRAASEIAAGRRRRWRPQHRNAELGEIGARASPRRALPRPRRGRVHARAGNRAKRRSQAKRRCAASRCAPPSIRRSRAHRPSSLAALRRGRARRVMLSSLRLQQRAESLRQLGRADALVAVASGPAAPARASNSGAGFSREDRAWRARRGTTCSDSRA